MPAPVRIVQLNLAYDTALADPASLLDRYHTLTGLAAALAAAGASVRVVQRFSANATLARNGVDYDFIADGGPPMPPPAWRADRVVEATVAYQPDVVHINGLMFPGMVRALRTDAPDVRIVVQDHSGAAPPALVDRLRDTSWRGLTDADAWSFTAVEHADPWRDAGLLSPTAQVLEILEASTMLAPVGRHDARRTTGLAGNPLILWVGRLNANKDPLTVVRGLQAAFERSTDARCCMVYHARTLEPDVRALVDRSPLLADRVVLAGGVPHADMPLYYSAADLFVSGSHHEGSGYALIEAMACGAIPVVTDIPSFRAITGDCGVRWHAGDPHSLADALLKAARFDRAAESARVRERFMLDLSWHAIGTRTVAAYRGLIA